MTPQALQVDETPTTPPKPTPLFLVIGAGSRGNAYAEAVTAVTPGKIHAIAEPIAYKRRELGRKYIWGSDGAPSEGQEFSSWTEWLEWEKSYRAKHGRSSIDGVFICTLDETHTEIVQAIAPLDLHILCEKPLALTQADCLSIYQALRPSQSFLPSKIFSIGHVLRYSPYSLLLRKLLFTDNTIGDIVSIEHTEPVGNWHFSHSYVRGNWRREIGGAGSLLTKSCHDVDFVMWLLSTPPPDAPISTPAHLPSKISSVGNLTHFRQARKPKLAGSATNCLSCPAEKECIYSSLKIYRDRHLRKGDTDWPVKIVCPEIEECLSTKGMDAAEKLLLDRLAEDYDQKTMPDAEIAARPWFGRCVYESDNDVCDDQIVTISWDDDPLPSGGLSGRAAKTAVIHMIAPTQAQCHRRGRIYGSHGEIHYDDYTNSITVYDFRNPDDPVTVHQAPKQPDEEKKAHGGGDFGLARQFVSAVEMVMADASKLEEAQTKFVGCSLEDVIRSHAVVFAAEESRKQAKVVDWNTWWDREVTKKLPLYGNGKA